MRLLLSFLFIFLTIGPAYSQSLNSAVKALEKGNCGKAREKLESRLKKDSADPTSLYVLAGLYFKSDCPEFDPLRAYRYAQVALISFQGKSKRDREKYLKRDIDSISISNLLLGIGQYAYVRAADAGTVTSMQYLIDSFGEGPWRERAVSMRDSIAWAEAKAIDSYEGYHDFLEKYPNSTQAGKAVEIYELRRFEAETAEGSAMAYKRFIGQFPTNRYVVQAQRRLYGLSTIAHTAESYAQFLADHPSSPYADEALFWLYKTYISEGGSAYDFLQRYSLESDLEIGEMLRADTLEIFPFLNESGYGLARSDGALLISGMDSLDAEVFCDGAGEDLFKVYSKGAVSAIDRTGQRLAPFFYDRVDAFAPGVLQVWEDGLTGLVSYTGTVILETSFKDIFPVGRHFIAAMRDSKYRLISYGGSELWERDFTAVFLTENNLLLLMDGTEYEVYTLAEFVDSLAKGQVPDTRLHVQAFQSFGPLFTKVKWQGKYGLLDADRQILLPFVFDEIRQTGELFFGKKGKGEFLYDLKGRQVGDTPVSAIWRNPTFYAARSNGKMALLDRGGVMLTPYGYDSIFLPSIGSAILMKGDSVFYTHDGKSMLSVGQYDRITLLAAPDTRDSENQLLAVYSKGKVGVVSQDSREVMPTRYDELVRLQGGWIKVKKGNRYGLFSPKGKELLPTVYDGIVSQDSGRASILQNGKFGLYFPKSNITIDPNYDGLLKAYGQGTSLSIARLNGQATLIDGKGKMVIPNRYSEIVPWSDSLCLLLGGAAQMAEMTGDTLLQDDDAWVLFSIPRDRPVSKAFSDYRIMDFENGTKFLRTEIELKHGLLGEGGETVLANTFYEILKVGIHRPMFLVGRELSRGKQYHVWLRDGLGNAIWEGALSARQYDIMVCE